MSKKHKRNNLSDNFVKNYRKSERSERSKLKRMIVRRNNVLLDEPKREVRYFTPYQKRALAVSDNRRYHPLKPLQRFNDGLVSSGYLTSGTFLDKIAFDKPMLQPVCIRRKARRRVLFAKRLTSKGSKALKHKFTDESLISCKG